MLSFVLMSMAGVNQLKAQSSVYYCNETGAYGYCYGKNDISTCTYNQCVNHGGTSPSQIFYTSSKGYVAIFSGTNSNGYRVIGVSGGYSNLDDAKERAKRKCINRGGVRGRWSNPSTYSIAGILLMNKSGIFLMNSNTCFGKENFMNYCG